MDVLSITDQLKDPLYMYCHFVQFGQCQIVLVAAQRKGWLLLTLKTGPNLECMGQDFHEFCFNLEQNQIIKKKILKNDHSSSKKKKILECFCFLI